MMSMELEDKIDKSGHNPIFGLEVDGYIVEIYRGFKSGAHLALFAEDADGDLCVAVISEKKFDGTRVQCNLIEGMRNGPSLKTDFSNIENQLGDDRMINSPIMRAELKRQGVDLTDEDTAYRECQEETGVDLRAMGIAVHPTDFRLDDGREHLNVMGQPNNFVLQNVGFFHASIPTGQPMPNLVPENDKVQVHWIKMQHIQRDANNNSFVIESPLMQGRLDSVQSGALMQAAKAHSFERLEQAYACSETDPKKFHSGFPQEPDSVHGWLKSAMNLAKYVPVFRSSRNNPKL